jgi:predicted 2-oxoglutarate/Fe(II)-dependent dioxygenase YbiX
MQPDGFEGGKLEYYDPNLLITPTAGLLVGHSYHVHRVTAITRGIRYTVAAFYDDL